MSEITSEPYRPAMACERCVWGRGCHADWCEWRVRFVRGGSNWADVFNPEEWMEDWRKALKQTPMELRKTWLDGSWDAGKPE